MPDPVHIPPPSRRFHWVRWAPYRNPNGRGPFDPPADSVIYLLKMQVTTVAQIWRRPDGRWKATCNTHQAEKLQRSALIDTEQEARDRLWAWAQREFPKLLHGRPNEYGVSFGERIYDEED